MRTSVRFLLLASALFLTGCGPDTIFVRPYLDTPEQHFTAGHKLLERGKYEDACREFMRARALMAPDFISVHVGLGLALGYKGDLDEGRKALDQAKAMAVTDEDKAEVQKGYERFEEIVRSQDQTPVSQ